jgi:chromosome segregation ATPase
MGLISGFLASYAIYQPQIQNLQTQQKELETQISSLQAENTKIKQQMNTYQNQIQDLEAQLNKYQKENESLKTQINEYSNEIKILEDEIERYKKDLWFIHFLRERDLGIQARLLDNKEAQKLIELLPTLKEEYQKLKNEGLTEKQTAEKLAEKYDLDKDFLIGYWILISEHLYHEG